MYRPIDLSELKEDKTLGYLYFMDWNHPLVNKSGKVYYHRHVISIDKGYWIDKSEVVHHIDGNRLNNSPSNLLVITNKQHANIHMGERETIECCVCGKVFIKPKDTSTYCSYKCSSKASRKFDPTKEELQSLVNMYPTTKVAKMYGVSDVAVAKRCRRLGISKPTRGYWRKKEMGKL